MEDHVNVFDALAGLIPQIAAIEIAEASLTRDTMLTGDLMLDSISLLSLMALTEERFGISFAEHTEEVADLATVGDAVDLVETLLAVKV
ncbi:acyl carrier protein [Paraburkholderia panacisoli]|jgi:acyl carrier protein|uniref:Acyl carrier protein n=1 Tax=Paraburkholderia panacisoli TaxID=2603818 RepID=A0A5B0GK77_9BURK|nr:phosphopantetheine-binding protein [Paraburkholderia panacisoli]KAA1003854.1 acyl carrier protein [Paraburkholderia panacisoli]